MTRQDITKLQQARRILIRTANGEERVACADLMEEAGVTNVSKRRWKMLCVPKAFRGVSYKHPRERIQTSEKDAK